MKGISGKVAIVTGGSSGIGRATALRFAEEGAQVVVADVVEEGGNETVEMIEEAGGDAVFVKTDVSEPADVEAMVEAAIDTYGQLDFAFNNAGIEGEEVQLTEQTEEAWDRLIGINLKGVWLGMKYEIPKLLEGGGGAIVNTASVAGLIGWPNLSPYVASKHGVIGLTRAAALDYSTDGIRVNAVAPGVIQTAMIDRIYPDPEQQEALAASAPVGRLGQPEEIASAVVWLCSDDASFVTGVPMPVDGGYVTR